MMIPTKIPLDVFDEEFYDKGLEEVKKLSKKKNSEEISSEVFKKMGGEFIIVQPLDEKIHGSMNIFRLRVPKPNEEINESLSSEFSCPPAAICELGRCNLKGQAVFYGSLDAHTTFHEVGKREDHGKIAYLSTWRLKEFPKHYNIRFLFLGLENVDDKSYSSIPTNLVNEQISKVFGDDPKKLKDKFLYGQRKYMELFTNPGGEYYHISASMINHMFVSMAKKGAHAPMVLYPSVKKNNQSVNIAISESYAKGNLYLKEVFKVRIKEINDKDVNYDMMARGVVQESKVVWSNVRFKMERIEYDKVEVFFKKGGKRFLAPQEMLTKCCLKHKMTIQQFYEANESFTEENLLETFSKMPITSEVKEGQEIKRILLTKPTNKLYVTNDISEAGEIAGLALPVSHSFQYVPVLH